jgi:tRNA (cmo5U34)-methyltransferase
VVPVSLASRDDLFARTARRRGDFVFDESVAAVFDDMLERSIPFYAEQQAMVAELARRHWRPATLVVDLGCSTGTTLVSVCSELPEANAVGVDSSAPMLERAGAALARAGLAGRVELAEADLNGGVAALGLAPASVVTICWTLQFVRPERRAALLGEIHDLLVPGGALVVAEKTVPEDARTADLYTDLYYELKERSGYSQTEIAEKRKALDGVLVPRTIAEHLAALREAGFESPSTFFQWYPFAAFLAVKASA